MITRTEKDDAGTGRVWLLFSCVKDKNYREELEMISRSGLFTDITAVPMKGARALDAAALRACVGKYSRGIAIHEAASVEDAVKRFILGRDKDDLVFAAGSLYLIGEMRDLIRDSTE